MIPDKFLSIAISLAIAFGMLSRPQAAMAQAPMPKASETLSIPRDQRGKPVTVTATLYLPPGSGKVPAVILHHGSGGPNPARDDNYIRELVGIGVAVALIDSFKPRGIVSTVTDQGQVSAFEMSEDALGTLKVLAAHPRIDGSKVGIVGFSKGGTVAIETMLERRAARILPTGPRFALHVSVYPGCTNHFRAKLTTAPVYMLLGAADTYAGVAPCTELAEKMKAAGAAIEVKIYPGAKHSFDVAPDYTNAKGENWSRCIFEEQADGSWKERSSGQTTFAQGKSVEAGLKAALAACRTFGVSGGLNAAARAAAMADLKAAVKRHLLGAP